METPQDHRYDWAAGGIILAFTALLANLWSHLPVFSDSWYHLGVIRAFYERGFSLHDWWSFAPFGRPHLYPPLFHLVHLAILKVFPISLLDLARLHCVVTYPLLLAAGWGAARCYFGARPAFLTLLLLSLNAGLLFPCSLIMMPATYALMLWAFLPWLILRRRWPTAGLLLAGIGYLHFGVLTAALITMLLLTLLHRDCWRTALGATGLGLTLFSPWLVHLSQKTEYLHSGTANLPVFIPLFTLVAGAVGIYWVWHHRTPAALAVLSLFLATFFFWFNLWERFWNYGGFFLAILAGPVLNQPVGRCRQWIRAGLVSSAVTLTPFLRPATQQLALPIAFQQVPGFLGTPFSTLVHWQTSPLPPPIADDVGALAVWIRQQTPPDAVLMTKDRLLGASLFVLTGRRSTSGLWTEVQTSEQRDKINQYRRTTPGLVIVNTAHPDSQPLTEGVTAVAEFGRYHVYWRRLGVTKPGSAS